MPVQKPMPRFPLIMRCLLIAALCLDVGVAQWTASVMAVTEAQQSSTPQPGASVVNTDGCDDGASQGSPDTSNHEDECDSGSACCRSEEHTSELQSLMRNSYAVFCLKKKT